jgi:hypothetical protein
LVELLFILDCNNEVLKMEELRGRSKWTRGFIGLLLITVASFVTPEITSDLCYADNAEVLPKGRSAVFVEGKFYPTIDERYGPNGDEEKLAVDFNTNLNRSVFPSLSRLETAFGLPAGSASLGRSVVSFEYDVTIVEFNYAYGITDSLSFGIKIPYWDFTNNVSAALDTTSATVGKNPLVPGGLAPIGFPGTQPLTANDIQSLLAQNYGFKPVQSWDSGGVSDIEGYLRYQYYKSENWRLAITPGVRFPTGTEDDPDSLVDYPFGTGAWAALIRFNQDYIGTKKLLLSSNLKFDYYFPDHKVMRIPDNVNQPITANKEEVDRQIGCWFEIELSGNYEFYDGLSFYLLYKYGYKWKDDISGSMGYSYSTAEQETNAKENVYMVGFQYTTVPLYLAKRFPVPMTAFFGYRNRFAAENLLKSQYWDLGLTVYF